MNGTAALGATYVRAPYQAHGALRRALVTAVDDAEAGNRTMSGQDEEREVVYVEREGGSVKPLLFGALLGLAVGLLFAPQSGEDTRRDLRRDRARSAHWPKSRGIVGEDRRGWAAGPADDRREDVRTDLERRLSAARARRQAPPPAPMDEDEKPVA